MTQSFQILVKTRRFTIPEELIPKLRGLQEQSRHYYKDEVVESEDAVVMTLGMGAAMYLALDGRVIVWEDELEEKTEPRDAKDVKEMFTAILIGAEQTKSPELLSLLPQRPKEALDCQECNKSGWRQFGIDVSGEPVKIICWDCGGIGWIINN